MQVYRRCIMHISIYRSPPLGDSRWVVFVFLFGIGGSDGILSMNAFFGGGWCASFSILGNLRGFQYRYYLLFIYRSSLPLNRCPNSLFVSNRNELYRVYSSCSPSMV
ncbi:uncharacterized protein BO95DRAFT_71982 [Aspergillus brunneoviolaceus CBS 621.78]|uniref:Uncharacterized protein n=1 Tax=Aspergillus brunneoviolaceus CBS 621.78 TaxID=1450534 RepID=A0ACD1GF42_9EURO|nr:hypothetical protein BO95DRAFT_71982 [Aspergillus brunneoviolaceus CBS 621.78]RAH47888.1 hypothetical protein BO95DRAFT_71982 [Aspergillus brunneoviolaceus CBS 621.78]